MSKQIKLKIFPDGRVQAETLGFRGKKCTDYIAVLEQLLDAEAIDSERTPEYYLEESEIERTVEMQTVKGG
ncbi:MAG: DUF2997 domain-containing protein [Candidatus Accumulibacter sp.]|jgi:hypothetical protein|nr:DUF2997 domain-containing protein [Accumulibacter sp.]